MYLQIILMSVGVALIIIALLTSKLVRAIFREAIFHRRSHCEIQVSREGVSVQRFPNEPRED
jgi:hypothetical protein